MKKRLESVWIEEVVRDKALEVAIKEDRKKMTVLSRWLVKGMESEGYKLEDLEGKECKK